MKAQNSHIASIQVFDVLGKGVVFLTPNSKEAKVDATQLKTGLYFAVLHTDSGYETLKLIKN
ncbi:T9SS type A sorting domain-containing protein [Mariniflexile ostreae]|uniref:T9SS type A sorting domain-containing protein n=1 Tax=Mariniflexile ostreae TaxID=1520892 RepID=A0ABV5FBI3_9FLAO